MAEATALTANLNRTLGGLNLTRGKRAAGRAAGRGRVPGTPGGARRQNAHHPNGRGSD